MTESSSPDWHALPVEEVYRLLRTSPGGVTEEEANNRSAQYGLNILEQSQSGNPLKILLRQLQNPLIYVLLASTALAFALGKFTDGLVVLAVVVINTIIGFIQEWGADKTIRGLMSSVPEFAVVIRNGVQQNIPATDLVPGDCVLLQAGDKISADIRLTAVKNLQCEEAALTGESLPAQKQTAPVEPDAGAGDRTCMAFGGTLATSGTGKGIVVLTGMKTEIGKISGLLQTTTTLKTPLTISIERLAKWITISIGVVCAGVLLISILRDYPFAEAIFLAVTLAVAAIPEGLPAVVTIASAVGVKRMAKRKAIIRRLPAVETLGSTTVICSDKTGTLTKNEMTVTDVWAGSEFFRVEETVDNKDDLKKEHFMAVLRAGVLCNDASTEMKEGEEREVGDPTEVALVQAFEKSGIDDRQLRDDWPRLNEIPFDSATKIMATLHRSPEGTHILFLKGAPEAVLPLINSNEEDLRQAREVALSLANEGKRLLAFAQKELPRPQQQLNEDDLAGGFVFLGLQAMIDPPRKEVMRAIEVCHRAGINVKMITGDHPGTALAIAKELNLTKDNERVVTGRDIELTADEQLQETVRHSNVFARVAPAHKLKLVQALQANGEVVAMTGDGVNDAPALKRADIGVAMGITGTAVSKEAADMILADDNFKSIEAAVEEGRRVYDNLLKSIAFVLPTSIGLGLIMVLAVLFFPFEDGVLLKPMQPVQVLWINLITAVALALPLAVEEMEPDVMRRPPRKRKSPLLTRQIIYRMLLVAAFMAGGTVGMFLWEYYHELEQGTAPVVAIAEAQTMSVTTMVLFQVFYLFSCRSLQHSLFRIGLFSNLLVYAGIGAVLLTQALFIYTPWMNKVFGSLPLKVDALGLTALIAFSIFPLVELEKRLYKKWL